jgi:L-ascorbate metabolism protein UlaG (beta-lactamase superfamily)
MKRSALLLLGLAISGCLMHVYAQTVKITPLGERTGDFCVFDRALLFEDPSGVRILYDPGNSVAGATDARLGNVHVILVSHAHGDHLGASRLNQDPDASGARCDAGAPSVAATPNSNAAEIAAAKGSAVVVGGNLASFLNLRIATILGATVPGCVPFGAANNEIVVPRSSPCTAGMGISGKLTATVSAGTPGVRIAMVPAVHDSSLANSFLTTEERSNTASARLTNYIDPANGYVLTFTNGLVVYLSGDTGLFGDMKSTLNEHYGAKLAVINIGDFFTMGPEEAADAVNRLIQPKAVIPSHANEVATTNGVVNENTRTARFINLLRGPAAYVARSGRVIEFDGSGNCTAGCLEIPVTGVTFSPSTVRLDGSFTATFTGTSLGSQTYFDIRYRAPGGTIDQLAFNWQQGITATHTLPPGTPAGQYTVTGVRAHQSPGDHSGVFSAVSATLVVTSAP